MQASPRLAKLWFWEVLLLEWADQTPSGIVKTTEKENSLLQTEKFFYFLSFRQKFFE